jgi:nitrite reductase/ring-hydroxylating ferredoxin subunit
VSGTPTAPTPTKPFVDAVEGAQILDGPAKAIGKKVRSTFGPGVVRDLLAGTWLGHALHPLLTDVVVGSFTSATLLDVTGGDEDGGATERLIGVGIVAALPTALSGSMDWADSEAVDSRVRRTGIVHAASNVTALGLYAASLAARRRGDRGRGKALALAGAGVLGAGGFLGGHLSFTRGVGVNQTVFDEGGVPEDWSDAMAADALKPGEPKSVVVGETPVMLLRHDDGLHALHDRCSHRGCSLTDMGEVEGEIVTCNCHGSQFDVRDGSVQRGPAATYQPVYEARESDGRIQVRLPSP